jgi:hypothetical protein
VRERKGRLNCCLKADHAAISGADRQHMHVGQRRGRLARRTERRRSPLLNATTKNVSGFRSEATDRFTTTRRGRLARRAERRRSPLLKAAAKQFKRFRSEATDTKELAPQVGLEPTTLRLTAECSAIELLRSGQTGRQGGGRPLELSS